MLFFALKKPFLVTFLNKWNGYHLQNMLVCFHAMLEETLCCLAQRLETEGNSYSVVSL